jgi:enamine deaminase RidA (YjgF/YER057c/UK114 family)
MRAVTRLAAINGGTHAWTVIESNHPRPERALESLESELGRYDLSLDAVLQLQFFVQKAGDLAAVRSALRDAFSPASPAVHLLLQPPCSGARVALLAWSAAGQASRVGHPADGVSRLQQPGLELTFFGTTEVAGAAAGPQASGARWLDCFQRFEQRLERHGLTWADVLKTWTYYAAVRAGQQAEFEAFNQARSMFFADKRFALRAARGARPYPANTGVTTLDRAIALAGIARSAASGPAPIALANPLQVAPSSYPREQLATGALFARAVALPVGSECLVLTAGTGSIVGARPRFPGQPARQAEQVLNLLDTLLSAHNVSEVAAGPAGRVSSAGLAALSHCLVYVVGLHDAAEVETVCRDRLDGIPTLLVQAALSRDELLVEMEGVAVHQ